MRVDRTNRVVLGLIGLLLLAAGVAVILAGTGVFGAALAGRSLLDNPVGAYFGHHGDWLWPVVGVVALVVAAVMVWWLVANLFGTNRVGHIDLAGPERGDRTTVIAGAVSDAVRRQIEGYAGVDSARAALVGTTDDPSLAVEVDTSRNADLAALRHRIEVEAIGDARQALDRPDLPATLDLTIRRREGARVS